MRAEKPKIFHIAKYPPSIGSRVKVWFDTKERHLLVEDETGRVPTISTARLWLTSCSRPRRHLVEPPVA